MDLVLRFKTEKYIFIANAHKVKEPKWIGKISRIVSSAGNNCCTKHNGTKNWEVTKMLSYLNFNSKSCAVWSLHLYWDRKKIDWAESPVILNSSVKNQAEHLNTLMNNNNNNKRIQWRTENFEEFVIVVHERKI